MAGVLSISQHGCIRVVKQGVALHNSGVPVEFLAERFANKEYAKVLAPLTTLYASQEAFDHYVRQSEASLFHIHNEPDWIVHRAKALRPDVPIVYDCHDLNCMRIGEAMEDEVLAMKAADAYIFPSHAYMEGAVKYHNIPDSKPRAVVYSMCPSTMLVDGVQMPRTGGIAYEGGLALCLPGADENARKLTEYRDYRPIAEALTGLEIPFTVYSGNNQFMYEYMMAGAVYISTLPHALMLRELTRHDWGLVGCPVPHPQWDTAMPNKLFEYISAGIPIVVLNASECAKFVEEHGIGIVVDRIEDVWSVYGDHEMYRERVQEIRHQFTMESQLPKIKAIYRQLMGASV